VLRAGFRALYKAFKVGFLHDPAEGISGKRGEPMDMNGEYRIEAPRDRVWQALNDPEILKQCIPGCQELEKKSDTEFSAKVTSKVGPVKATFNGSVNLTNVDPPNGYTISGEGQGGVAGFAKGGADVSLAEDNGATVLTYAAKAEVGGKLASVGSRLVLGVAKKTADEFFSKFSEIVGGAPAAAPAAAPAVAETAPETAAEPAPAPAMTSVWTRVGWAVGIIVALALLYVLLAR
jgi:carbon monoxide dehydrogenase subunit G